VHDDVSAEESRAERRVDAEPTKEFFVSMLIRDIELHDSVIDLLDNSVDGARRLRGTGSYSGLHVFVNTARDEFLIRDNCGGIPVDLARKYAFRFGRDPRRPANEHTIGQFGVGMKRTLFKIGQKFEIDSKTTTDSFRLEVDVAEWRQLDEWDFWLSEVAEGENRPEADTGTTIRVTQFNDGVASDLTNDRWINRLRTDARLKHRLAIARGMTITINEVSLEPLPLGLKESDDLKPARIEHTYNGGGAPVSLRILVGISDSDPQAAGWYIFCNDRLVLGPDRTSATVWEGGGRHTRGSIPAYHDQYSRFRGYAFFDCDDASRLPWTTTKKGVDADSPIWRDTRQRMKNATRPVIDFLNELDKERTAIEGDRRAGQAGIEDIELLSELADRKVQDAPVRKLDEVVGAASFQRPIVNLKALPAPMVWLRFDKPKTQVDEARRLMGGTSERDLPNKEVGSQAFDYFLQNEGEGE